MGIGFKELLIILAIALLIFGAKRLRTIGSDLGGAVKGFKKAMDEGEDDEKKQLASPLVKGSDASPLVRGSDASPLVRGSDASPDPKDADSASTPPSGKTGGKSNA